MSLQSEHIITIDSYNPNDAAIQKAVSVISSGGVIIYPTDTIYGLGCDAFNEQAVRRVYEIKRRPENKPMLILIDQRKSVSTLVESIPPDISELMDHCWPGPLTILLPIREHTYSWLSAGTGKIGIRMPNHSFCRKLIAAAGVPLLSTSANISGEEFTGDVQRLKEIFADRVNLFMDAGTVSGNLPSTILDGTSVPPLLVREGALKRDELAKYINFTA